MMAQASTSTASHTAVHPAPIPLDAEAATDPRVCGHKAGTLAWLHQRGLGVPDGVILRPGTDQSPEQLQGALERLGGRVAVRSSGLQEDGPSSSWAGQLLTVLDVDDAQALVAAIAACRASVKSVHAQAHARRHGVEEQSVAVLIQRMVPAEVAGVAFSADPVSGDEQTVVISAVRGLADALVSGKVTGDEWVVRAGEATARVEPEGVLSPALALEIAALARKVAQLRGAPQDIEWAWAHGKLWLVQARPIVDLPLEPTIQVPPGSWARDIAHFPEPVTPLGATIYLPNLDEPIAGMMAEWGLMPDAVETRRIGHEVYSRGLPETGKAPPWWLLAIVARIAPPIRKKLQRCAQVVASGRLQQVADSWSAELRSAFERQVAEHRSVDLSALSDPALLAHLDELIAFARHGQEVHFRLFIPYLVGLHDLHLACAGPEGWQDSDTLSLLQGLSTASAAPTRELHALAQDIAAQPQAREVVARQQPDMLDQLQSVAPELAVSLQAWLGTWGLRCIGYDPGLPSLSEQPLRVVELLAEALDAPDPTAVETLRQRAIDQVRERLSGDQLADFDDALAFAEQVYPQREDNVAWTDGLPGGLLRRAALEIGRRLTQRGMLDAASDVAFLELDELRQLSDPPADLRGRVQRRRRELAWVRAHPGPVVYGDAPPAPPDIRGLPEPARRLNGAILWAMAAELAPPPPPRDDGSVHGLAASAGRYRGRVRVVRRAEDLHQLRRGEVMVCRITTPAWSVYFPRAGALVTDGGSPLSHAAIIAREHGVPAVVATGCATSRLRDGMDVTVDGSTGAVTIH